MEKCSLRNCKNECFEKQNRCILHCEKESSYQIDDNNSKLFYDALIDYITLKILWSSEEYKKSIDPMEYQKTIIWNFLNNVDNNDSSFDIKKALKNQITLADIHFPIDGSLNNEYNYMRVLNKLTNIEFKNCKFKDDLLLNNDKNLKFRKCTFLKEWHHIFCSEIKYIECIFEDFIIDNISEDKKIVENHLLYNCGFKNIFCSGTRFKKRFFKFDNLNKYKKIIKIKFKNCEFDEDFILNITDNENQDRQYFRVTNINLINSIFYKKVKIQFCEIKEKANFFNTSFKDLADFYNTEFNEAIFERTDFEKVSVFSEVEFHQNVDFKYTKFLGKAIFRDTVIKGELNLRNTIFDDEANFLDITSQKRKKSYKNEYIGDVKDIKVSNRETARIIKNFYDNSNNIIEANKFYALEMKEREKELDDDIKKGKNFFEWLVFKIHGISSNHSQDWLLALFWIMNITFSLFITEKSIELFGSNLIAFIPICTVLILGINVSILNNLEIRTVFLFLISFINFGIFKMVSEKHTLNCVSDKINPFSIMTELSQLNFITFIYKIIIAYLIYQLIISIRQNTRRK